MTSKAVAMQLANKLQDFRSTLNADEQQALDSLLISFGNLAAKVPTGERLVVPPGGADAIADIKKAIPSFTGEAETFAITPTVTTVTITTTVASHPVITCK